MNAFSQEWVEEFTKKIQRSESYQKMAVGFDASIQFEILPSPEKGIHEQYFCGLYLPDGSRYWSGNLEKSDFTLTASYDVFYRVLQNEWHPLRAIALGKIKLQGSKMKLARYIRGVDEFMKELKRMDTQFHGHYL